MDRILDIGYCLSVPEKNDGCFIIKKVLGKGASSVTYLAECNQTEHVLKECNPLGLHMHRDNDGALVPDTELNKVKFEEYLFRFVDGASKQLVFRLTDDLKNTTSNIQAIYHANGTVYIDMTYFNGDTYDNIAEESLYDLLRRMKALAQVIGHYHDMGYLHLDVKPQNIYAIPETPEMVMMFDFDSVVPVTDVEKMVTLSYTDTWAAPEQKMAKYRHSICKATDLFAIGEIIFHRITGRHSTADERFDFSKYDYNRNAKIFENVNAQVHGLLDELFHHTICISPSNRFQNAEELIALLEKIIPLADPQKPVLPHKNNIVPKGGFIGRDTELQDIHARLQQNPILFLHGIGGIGKSELAKQYAVRYQSEYDTVFFAPYDTDIVFLIANDSGITINNFSRAENEAVEKYYERKLKILKELISENDGRILLIVDNLNTREDKNIKVLFELGCRVLVTSRVDLGATFMRPQMEVKAFSDMAIARELFNQYYQFSEAEATDVDAIINHVQGHTLAIELIAKQVEAEWSTVHEIREKLESGGLSSIGDENIDNVKNDDLSQNSAFGHIKALFDLSVFEKDNKNNELYILANLSLMPFSGIDRDLFAKWCDLDRHGGKSCIRRLNQSGWIRSEGSGISLHPLISDVLHDIITTKNVEVLISRFSQELTDDDTGEVILQELSFDIANIIATTTINLFDSKQQLKPTKEIIHCIGKFGEFFFEQSLFNLAEKSFCMQQEFYKRLNLSDAYTLLVIFNNLALLYDKQGELYGEMALSRKALDYLTQCLSIVETPQNNMGEYIGTVCGNIGSIYHTLRDYDNAEIYYKKALESSDRYSFYNAMGVLYENKGIYLEALKMHQKAMEKATNHNEPKLVIALIEHNMAVCYKKLNMLDSAIDYCKKSLRIREESLDSNSSYDIALSKSLLGQIYVELGESRLLNEAKSLLNEAALTFRNIVGEESGEYKKAILALNSVNAI